MKSSNFLVFVDEAGDQMLAPNYAAFPILVLAFVIISKDEYCDNLLPKFARLKLKYFPDVNTIFHEREIRKALNDFEILTNTEIRESFMQDLTDLMQEIDYKVISAIIDKSKVAADTTDNLYELAVQYGITGIRQFLDSTKDRNYTTITFEARGRVEDKNLRDFFASKVGAEFGISLQGKSAGGFGLQFSDLIARPIGTHFLKPNQRNRAWDVINGKLCDNGLIIIPK